MTKQIDFTCSEASSIGMADAFFYFHGTNFE